MRKNSKLILAGAVLVAIPAVTHAAVTFTVTLDTTTLKYGTSGTASSGWTALPLGTSVAAAGNNGAYFNTTTDTAYIPSGDGLVYGIDGSMTGTTATAAAVVGIAQFAFGMSNSLSSVAVPSGGTTTGSLVFTGANTPVFNSNFATGPFTALTPKSNGNGGINPTVSQLGTAWGSGTAAPAGYAPITSGLLVSNLEIDIVAGATPSLGTTAIALTNYTSGATYRGDYAFTTAPTPGSAGSGADVVMSSATDTISLAGAVLNVGVATPGGTTTSHQPIVTLLNTTPTTYGSQIGTAISITGHNSSYSVGNTGLVSGVTTGYTAVSVFNPLTDTEVYALKLNEGGGALSPTSTLIATIVADINASAVNVSAGAITGQYAALFPGYDILLVSSPGFTAGAGGVADLGIDFSGDTDAATPGLVVTEVAAVPEPATAAGVVLGAAGLLLGRRKKQVATA